MNDARRDVALFRYSLVREAADESLTMRQRGALVRDLAQCDHVGPDGRRIVVPRNPRPVDPGLSLRRVRGVGAGATHGRADDDKGCWSWPRRSSARCRGARPPRWPRSSAPPRARAVAAHAAAPLRPARAQHPPRRIAPQAFGRFEAAAPGTCGPATHCTARRSPGRKTYLFAFIDDHSRAWSAIAGGSPRTPCASRPHYARRSHHVGFPAGATWTTARRWSPSSSCGRVPASGSALCTAEPGRPQGRGKIERFFETVRIQFLVEIEARPPARLAELNRLFSAWVETVYHRRIHSETGEAPIERLLAGPPPCCPPTPRSMRRSCGPRPAR